jgi:hypothetical protein
MIETSTPATNSLPKTKAEISLNADDLGEDEQSFYSVNKIRFEHISQKSC